MSRPVTTSRLARTAAFNFGSVLNNRAVWKFEAIMIAFFIIVALIVAFFFMMEAFSR